MDAEKLVQMANRIGEFFAAWPDRDEAMEGIATHLRKFWEPRMRRDLLALIDAGQADVLMPLVLEAVIRRRQGLEPNG